MVTGAQRGHGAPTLKSLPPAPAAVAPGGFPGFRLELIDGIDFS